MKEKVIIFDINGTIADCSHRLPLISGPCKKDWDKFHSSCCNDTPIPALLELLGISLTAYKVILCTGRPSSSRNETVGWLNEQNIGLNNVIENDPLSYKYIVHKLLMRKNGDYRPDWEIKEELLTENGYTPDNVLFMVDDRTRVVKYFRSLGYTVLQCAQGDY